MPTCVLGKRCQECRTHNPADTACSPGPSCPPGPPRWASRRTRAPRWSRCRKAPSGGEDKLSYRMVHYSHLGKYLVSEGKRKEISSRNTDRPGSVICVSICSEKRKDCDSFMTLGLGSPERMVVNGMNPSLTNVENIHTRLYLRALPASCIGYCMTSSAHILMERDDNFGPQELQQIRLVVGQSVAIGYLEDSADEHSGCRLLK